MENITNNDKVKKLIFWLPLFILIVHATEEFVTGFPAWATDHFGMTTPAYFVYTHILLVLLVVTIAYLAKGSAFWKMMASAAMMQFATNAVFHLSTTLLFGEVAPGILTASFVALPLSYIFFMVVLKQQLLTKKQVIVSMALGFIVALLIISMLWFDGSIGWDFSLTS